MPTAITDISQFDPLEQYIYTVFHADSVLRNLFGPYFDWDTDPQGVPYCVCSPNGGDPNIYPILDVPGGQRSVIASPHKQFSVYTFDRTALFNENTGILPRITQAFEALGQYGAVQLKNGSKVVSCIMSLPWQGRWEKSRPNLNQANLWHAWGYFHFRTDRAAGAVV